jgi:hypothetical protein
VVIDELLDHVGRRAISTVAHRGRGSAREDVARKVMVVRHPLQPFSPRYFSGDDPRLFTYSRAQARAARAGRSRRSEDLPFVEVEALDMPGLLRRSALLTPRTSATAGPIPASTSVETRCASRLALTTVRSSDDELFSLGPMESGGVKARILSARWARTAIRTYSNGD